MEVTHLGCVLTVDYHIKVHMDSQRTNPPS
jgi:hypothetical protein